MPGRLNAYIGRRFMAAIAMMLGGVALVVFVAHYVELLRRFSDEDAFTPFLGVELALMSVPIILDSLLPFAFLAGLPFPGEAARFRFARTRKFLPLPESV